MVFRRRRGRGRRGRYVVPVRRMPAIRDGRGAILYPSHKVRSVAGRIAQSLNPLPFSRTVRLRYNEYVTFNPAGSIATYQFSANSLYDPNATLGGHQPFMYDKMAENYNHYLVLGSKITVTFWTEDAAGIYGAIAGIKLADDLSIAPTGGVQTVIEHGPKYSTWKFLRTNAHDNHNPVTLSKTFSAKKFFGLKDVKDNRGEMGAAINANPTESAYFILFASHPDQATDLPVIHANVTIDYIANFSEPKDQIQS